MAISIDTVYQKVLALANKEQRGYITPQEFNLFADHAQKEIFEQYFYDLNQFKRMPGHSGEYSDIVSIIEDKISLFEYWAVGNSLTALNKYGDINLKADIPDLYRLGEISREGFVCEQLSPKQFVLRNRSKLTKHSKTLPVFVKHYNHLSSSHNMRIKIYPYPVNSDGSEVGAYPNHTPQSTGIRADYIRKPKKPNWSYQMVQDKPFFNDDNSQDFELHDSEESELVYRILALAGISIEKPSLMQAAMTLETTKVQQEKQ
jgi:hypothetical protein